MAPGAQNTKDLSACESPNIDLDTSYLTQWCPAPRLSKRDTREPNLGVCVKFTGVKSLAYSCSASVRIFLQHLPFRG